jgi:arabinogalactan oligomer/maltooligosaccharide transport system substrate-binding protein
LRKSLHVAAASAVAISFAFASIGVQAANHTNASTTPPKLKKGVTLTIWDYFGSDKTNPERLAMEKVANAWAKKYGEHVTFAGNTNANNTKMCTAGPAGQGPDIVGVPHDQVSVMTACKTIAAVPAWAWTPAEKKLYIKAAIQATTISGKTYSMPWAIETTGLFYNKTLLPSSFFKPGKGQKYVTWAKVVNKAKSLTNASSGTYGLGWDLGNFYYDFAFVSGYGGYVFKYNKGYQWQDIGLNSAKSVKGLNFLRDITVGKYKAVPPTMTDSTANGLFQQGKLAMYWSGPWNIASFQQANVNFGFAPIPSFDGKKADHAFSGVQVFAVNKFSKNANEAFSLLSYMTQNMQIPEFKTSGRIPVVKSLLNSKSVQRDPIAKGIASAALAAQPMPNIPEMNQVWTPMGTALTAIVKGSDTTQDAVDKAVTQIKSDIAKAHGG